MDLTFNRQNANKLVEKIEEILQNFNIFIQEWEELPSTITKYSSKFINNKIIEVLKQIPIEEINDGKFSFNIPKLKHMGVKTFNDLAYKSESELIARYNIVPQESKKIKICLDDVIQTIRKKRIITLDEINYLSDDIKLISALYKYIYCNYYMNICNEFLNNNIKKIYNDIDILSNVPIGIGKFFISNETKENLNNAYENLYNLLYNSDFSKNINSLTSIMTISNNIAFNDFIENKEKYEVIMEKFYPNRLNKNGNVNSKDFFNAPFTKYDIKELKTKFQDMLLTLYSINDVELNKLATIIKINANIVLKEQILNNLKDITLESLNARKLNIKIKPLQNAGYTTVYDLWQKTPYELARIGGISLEMANKILNVCETILNETSSTAKLKINSDNKNSTSTSLIRSILAYINYNAIKIKAENLLQSYEKKINVSLNCLDVVNSKIKWLYTNTETQTKIVHSYEFLMDLLNGECFNIYSSIINQLETNNNLSDKFAWDSFNKNPIVFFNILEILCPNMIGSDDTKFGLPRELAEQIEKETIYIDGLICKLKRYQEYGVKYILHQKKALLGDEMGLGKTIQAIATMVSMRNMGATHFMVVCPASVLENWVREIIRHSDLQPIKLHGKSRLNAFRKWQENGGVAVTTYETTGILKFEDDSKFNLLVVDEAHYVKNPDALRTKRITNMSKLADRLLFMTGTALENRLDEMINLIDILNPELADVLRNTTTPSIFKDKVAPIYYRRRRKDVLTELPDLQEYEEWCDLTQKEIELYEECILNKNFMQARRLSWNVPLDKSTKANRMLEIIDKAKDSNRKVIVFSFFLDTIANIAKILGNKCVGIITGATSPKTRQEIIDSFDDAPDGSVIVSQIQSGGIGLNIQAASVVILCEPQYKPSTEQQAISRAYRMGQPRNVLVYKLLATNTIDERMTQMLYDKQKIFDDFADESVVAIETIKLDKYNLKEILQSEIDRIKSEKKLINEITPIEIEDIKLEEELEENVNNTNNISNNIAF